MEYKFNVDNIKNVEKRLDVFLANEIDGQSRSHIQKLIEEGNVFINEKIKTKSNYKLRLDDVLIVNIPEAEELEVLAENIPLDILYEDSDVIVVNKPRGMVVHPAPGNYNGTLVNALLYHCKDLSGINGIKRPGIVHRIDKDTSGVLVVAKNDIAHICLAAQFKEHTIKREYIALVEGNIKVESGVIDKPIARHPRDRVKMAIVQKGKRAVTHFNVIERFSKYTLVNCQLETGRTHQIRVHLKDLGYPLVGDTVYGLKNGKFKLEGQFLHAQKLGFIHPTKKEYIEFEKETPKILNDILIKVRNMDNKH
ncbi:RluA family pseudouridine synthase [Clostridium sediminicola]|uniref:RluA family pseudouridine synthase n=1 Tax=Clostridium sediminicola TaxID=3114879 RepID=UPI0031F23361